MPARPANPSPEQRPPEAPSDTLARVIEDLLQQRERTDFPALPGRTNHLPAGVLVPLVLEGERAEVILQQRPTTMRQHPGEISLPGGRRDPTDADLTATALREAQEELGIVGARVLGTLSSYPLYTSDYRLHPTVARLAHDDFTPNAAEVEAVHRLDLWAALELPFIQGIPWDLNGKQHVSPIFDIGAPRVVFGGTAQVLFDMLEVFAAAVGKPVPPTRVGTLRWADILA